MWTRRFWPSKSHPAPASVKIQGQESRGIAVVINAHVPLANMFKYVDNLRSMSQGRAQYTMSFDHYAPVPNNVAQEIQAKYSGQK